MPSRRQFLSCLAFGSLSAHAQSRLGRVTLDSLDVTRVHVNRRGNWILPEIKANTGLIGLGDASHGNNDEATLRCLQEIFSQLKGLPLGSIEQTFGRLGPLIRRNGLPGTVAWGGIEQCLWDLMGKTLDVPVYDLFGGPLAKRPMLLRQYANINRSTPERTPAGFAAMAAAAVKDGFTAVKLAPFDSIPVSPALPPAELDRRIDEAIACATAVREAIGKDNDLLIDVHSRLPLDKGMEVTKRFEPLKLFWLEEVTSLKKLDELAAINRAAAMPTAGGEETFGVQGFQKLLQADAFDILMPDIKYCGGMWQLKKIAALAKGFGAKVSPHGPASPVGNAAAAQVCATLPNFLILEFSYGEVPWRSELVQPREEPVNGHIVVGDAPGLGISLNRKVAEQYRV